MKLSALTLHQTLNIDESCNQILEHQGIRFAGIINNKGRLVAGGFKAGIEPHIDDERKTMLFMELMLDLSMRKEFDGFLGSIYSIVSRRDKINLITVPLPEHLLLVSTETFVDENMVMSTIHEVFQSHMRIQNAGADYNWRK